MEKLKCRICGKSFSHLGSHVWHKHKLLARQYKENFGMSYNEPLVSREIRDKQIDNFERNKEKILPNLLIGGEEKRFKKGGKHSVGRYRSENEWKKVKERIDKVNAGRTSFQDCPVCKGKYKNMERHLAIKHGLAVIIHKGD